MLWVSVLMPFENKTLTCRDCNKFFMFTSGEQEFFAAKGLANEPKRCPNCRITHKLKVQGKDATALTELACHECGALTRVPFRPTGARPVYCSPCMHQKKESPS